MIWDIFGVVPSSIRQVVSLDSEISIDRDSYWDFLQQAFLGRWSLQSFTAGFTIVSQDIKLQWKFFFVKCEIETSSSKQIRM